MTIRTSGTLAAGALLVAMACATAAHAQGQSKAQPATAGGRALATADMIGTDGKSRGTATFLETQGGTLIQLRLNGIPPGPHGIHIHETGQCQTPDFKSAGSHYNPGGKSHGFVAHADPHAGDLPNVFAQDNGQVWADLLTTSVSAEAGQNSLFTTNGTALVLHAGADDYMTDPAGGSGDRIACGVIKKSTQQ